MKHSLIFSAAAVVALALNASTVSARVMENQGAALNSSGVCQAKVGVQADKSWPNGPLYYITNNILVRGNPFPVIYSTRNLNEVRDRSLDEIRSRYGLQYLRTNCPDGISVDDGKPAFVLDNTTVLNLNLYTSPVLIPGPNEFN